MTNLFPQCNFRNRRRKQLLEQRTSTKFYIMHLLLFLAPAFPFKQFIIGEKNLLRIKLWVYSCVLEMNLDNHKYGWFPGCWLQRRSAGTQLPPLQANSSSWQAWRFSFTVAGPNVQGIMPKGSSETVGFHSAIVLPDFLFCKQSKCKKVNP